MPTINSFEGLKEKFDDESTNIGVKKTVKAPPIYVARVDTGITTCDEGYGKNERNV
jgi:hypothetical protein